MSARSNAIDPILSDYVRDISGSRETPELARLREITATLPDARMQISVEQGQFMGVLAKSLGVKRALEVGVFTGYSALCVARQLPPDGKLVACEVSEEWTAMARPFWESAGVADRIDLRIGPAAETLDGLISAGESGTYDFAFIDADKQGYDGYYEQCLTLLRPGGVVALDNSFMGGRVVDPEPDDVGANVVRDLTRKIFADERVDPAIIPISDGLVVARKR